MDGFPSIPNEVKKSGIQFFAGGLIVCDFSYSKRGARNKVGEDFVDDLERLYKYAYPES